jgi:hypothetical protein
VLLHRACRAWAGGSASRPAGGLPASPAPRENRNWTGQDKVGARASIDAGEKVLKPSRLYLAHFPEVLAVGVQAHVVHAAHRD